MPTADRHLALAGGNVTLLPITPIMQPNPKFKHIVFLQKEHGREVKIIYTVPAPRNVTA
jgi:hypothetical protein